MRGLVPGPGVKRRDVRRGTALAAVKFDVFGSTGWQPVDEQALNFPAIAPNTLGTHGQSASSGGRGGTGGKGGDALSATGQTGATA